MSLTGLLAELLTIYGWLIIAYVVLGWFVMGNRGGGLFEVYRALATVCEPYLSVFRRILPPVMVGSGGLDFSPFIALIVLQVVSGIIVRIG